MLHELKWYKFYFVYVIVISMNTLYLKTEFRMYSFFFLKILGEVMSLGENQA